MPIAVHADEPAIPGDAAGDRVPPTHQSPPSTRDPSLQGTYASFWQAGFEGADHINGSATPLCLNTLSGHLRHARGDYVRALALGMRTVRESASWRCIDRAGRYDFDMVTRRARHAQALGMQATWTAWHYGVPSDVDVFDDTLPARFADYCRALALHLRGFAGAHAPVYTPVNEISFFSWAVCETGLMHPHRGERAHDGYDLKCRLVRAAIAGMQAIRDVQPDARFLHVDPLIHVAAPIERPDLDDEARRHSDYQYQDWDMLAGRIEPQLGGGAQWLDLVGVNYYHANQWELGTRMPLHWHLGDPRRRPLSAMLQDLWARYARPITVSETSHVGSGRAHWMREVAREVAAARADGVPIDGVCVYPAIDRPDWEQPQRWHRSGLWDVHAHSQMRRRLHRPYARALRHAQRQSDLLSPARDP